MTAGINYTPASLATNHKITATEWATEITNPFTGLQSAWDPYTPALTATVTNPTLGSGSSVAGTTTRIGKWIIGTAEIVFGSSGVSAGSGIYGVSIPVAATAAAVSAGRIVGDGVFFDSSTGNFYHLMCLMSSTSTVVRLVIDVGGSMTAAVPVASAVNDQIRIRFEYEAA